MAARRKLDRRRDDPCEGGLGKRVQESLVAYATGNFTIRQSSAILARSVKRARQVGATPWCNHQGTARSYGCVTKSLSGLSFLPRTSTKRN